MNEGTDVIAAIASGSGNAAIGVVRLSGAGSHPLAMRLCRDLPDQPESRRVCLTWLVHPDQGLTLDQATVVFYPTDGSYTGEEAVEFFCHGGRFVLGRVLDACLDAGARPARAGEFTRRAVASGRLDLAQAEAVALLTTATGESAADIALCALQGTTSEAVRRLREHLLDVLGECEAYLDFTDDDGVDLDLEQTVGSLEKALEQVDGWLVAERENRPALQGVRVVLIGPPNAGKSSLFNAIVGKPRAIVHDEPGTTRDVVSESVTWGGIACQVMDTAGLRVSDGAVESEGVSRALEAARDADLTVLVIDGSDPGRTRWMKRWIDSDLRCHLVVLAKADLWESDGHIEGVPPDTEPWVTSAATGLGLPGLRKRLGDLAAARAESAQAADCVLAGQRQVEAVENARRHCAEAVSCLESQGPLEVAVSALRNSVEALGEVTGAQVTEAILDRIFSRFCIGK